MQITQLNNLLSKSGIGIQIRAARGHERQYGRWVRDAAERQATRGWETLGAAAAAALEDMWDQFDGAALTDKERQALQAIPSNVARLI